MRESAVKVNMIVVITRKDGKENTNVATMKK